MEERRSFQKFPSDAFVALSRAGASYYEVRSCVFACHAIAVSYLRLKSPQLYRRNLLGLSIEDLAYDAIADLFERDEEGSFPQFTAYFGSLPQERLADRDVVFVAIRRLVFSAVNNRLFRIYGLEDPAAAKILRNLKLELKKSRDLKEDECAGGRFLTTREFSPTTEYLPMMPSEFLAAELSPLLGSNVTIPEILAAASQVLTSQSIYRQAIPLYEFVHVIKNLMAGRAVSGTSDEQDPHALTRVEILEMSGGVIHQLRIGRGAKYVQNQRLSLAELDAHLRSVSDILVGTFINEDGSPEGFYDILKSHLPALTIESYASRHRVILEYFARTAKAEMLEILRREVQVL